MFIPYIFIVYYLLVYQQIHTHIYIVQNYITNAPTIYKLPTDGAEAPKQCVCVCVCARARICWYNNKY